jgi:hypothetical protein
MSLRQRVQYIEIDVETCSLTYGVAPCTAELGVTGPIKCTNTTATCQVREAFAPQTVTLRFAVDVGAYLPRDIPAVPNIESHDAISFTAGEISLGKNLGTRSSLKVTFRDHRHPDAGPGYDPYWDERGYDPFKRGSHWGKFRARQPYLQGRPLRWVQGFAGQTLAEMETRHFFIESYDGPGLDGRYSITAKDVLKFLDDDRALAPRPSNGELATVSLAPSDVEATLQPAGIGDAEYPTEGYATIGGAEVVGFTRIGDVLTIVRGRLGTEAVEHEQGDRIQVLLRFDQEKVSDIINTLMAEYADVDTDFIPSDDWHDEDDAYIGRLYTGNIAEPTAVRKLVNELIEQVGLAIWWDDVRQKIRFQALRRILTDAGRITPSNVDENTLTIREQPTKRLSEMMINYGLRSPLHPLGEFTSYRESRFLRSAVAAADYGQPAFREVFSRWIARFQTNTASRVGAIQIGRFRDPPRKFSFSMFRQEGGLVVEQGGGYLLSGWPMQDETGATVDVPIQVTRLTPLADRFLVEAEEMTFAELELGDIGDPDPPPPPDSPVERIIILGDGTNINLRAVYDSLYADFSTASEEDPLPITFIVPAGRVIRSATGAPALTTGSFPTDVVDLKLIVRGRVQGMGGTGGQGGTAGGSGSGGGSGGTAFQATVEIDVEMQAGEIWGGGGGGGGAATRGGFTFNTRGGGGGGGAGNAPGGGGYGPDQAAEGSSGSATAGGPGGYSWTKDAWWEWEYPFPSVSGGQGGSPGQAGLPGTAQSGSPVGSPGAGGAAGPAIQGIGLVAITGSGSILGPQV